MSEIKNFENDMASLQNILDKLQNEEISLDETISLYANAAELISSCNNILTDANLQIEEITKRIPKAEEE